jgi:hypothetical protein
METFNDFFDLMAIPVTLAFIAQVIFIFMAGDNDSEVDTETNHDIHNNWFTLKSLIFFMTSFTWTVILCRQNDFGVLSSVIIGFISGMTLITILSSLTLFMKKLQHSGTMSYDSVIGKTGIVYLPIPLVGIGKINITIQGTERELDAIAHSDVKFVIETGTIVEVINHISGLIVVKPIK